MSRITQNHQRIQSMFNRFFVHKHALYAFNVRARRSTMYVNCRRRFAFCLYSFQTTNQFRMWVCYFRPTFSTNLLATQIITVPFNTWAAWLLRSIVCHLLECIIVWSSPLIERQCGAKEQRKIRRRSRCPHHELIQFISWNIVVWSRFKSLTQMC